MMEMKYFNIFFLCVYLTSFILFFTNSKMFLISLVLSELIMLNSFFLMIYFLCMEKFLSFMLFYFIMIVCESCLGLSIFISMIRLNGSNMFNQSNFCLC